MCKVGALSGTMKGTQVAGSEYKTRQHVKLVAGHDARKWEWAMASLWRGMWM